MIIWLENKLSQTKKKNWFYMVAMVDFFTTHDFGQKLNISSLFFLDKMGLEVVFDDCPRLQILYFT